MRTRLPIILTTLLGLALVAPGTVLAKEGKDKGKDKKNAKAEQGEHRANAQGGHDDDDNDRRDGGGKVTICHNPPGNASARHTITIGESAWNAHRAHGDDRGACRNNAGGRNNDNNNDRGERRNFENIDRNQNNFLSRGEWPFGNESFDRLDRNHDNMISRDEYRRR